MHIWIYMHVYHAHTLRYVTLHYITLHYTTLHYITLVYIRLRYINININSTLHDITTHTAYIYMYMNTHLGDSSSRWHRCQMRLACAREELGGMPDYLLEALGGEMMKCSSIVTAGTVKSQASAGSGADWLEAIEEPTEAEGEMWKSSNPVIFSIWIISTNRIRERMLQCLYRLFLFSFLFA